MPMAYKVGLTELKELRDTISDRILELQDRHKTNMATTTTTKVTITTSTSPITTAVVQSPNKGKVGKKEKCGDNVHLIEEKLSKLL